MLGTDEVFFGGKTFIEVSVSAVVLSWSSQLQLEYESHM